ncbi:hypothetical protein B0H15DRAFT_127701 [Mycena belliarum]|uniref:Uncharacterized protein n=1 Tax=Mycena belliarum TaxID=1033014 RepID=A0AAD6UDF7_9AGAR|nr:hypothetical protein B0H15DRAFT_127701 [Mycena belliae]
MHLLQLLPIGLLALLVAAGDPLQSPDVDSLNHSGLSPCDMKNSFQRKCTTQRRDDLNNERDEDGDDDTNSSRVPRPTPCTCTNLYFNLWSACLYTKTRLNNSSLPLSGTLKKECAQASPSLNVTQIASTDYPPWAQAPLPSSNGTFDPVAAIDLAVANGPRSRKWNTVQIVVPILVGLVVAATLIVGFVVYRRRKAWRQRGRRPWMKTAGNRPRFNFPTISSATKVRELNRSSSWSIDDREEDLDEYQFVSYPASLEGSQVSGHVRLSPSTSAPPTLKIPTAGKVPVRTWPGKSLWKGPLQSAQRFSESIPRPWKSTRQVAVKTIPSYSKFRVDASDSDSPLSQRPHESLLGAERSRSNLHHETVFEEEDEESSDSESEGLPFIPQEHSRSNHEAEPPILRGAPPPVNSSTRARGPPDLNSSTRAVRQAPPSRAPPTAPLPPPPPQARPEPSADLLERPQRPHPAIPSATISALPQRLQRPYPAFPPAPTSPPPSPPVSKSPRAPRAPLSSPSGGLSPSAMSPRRFLPPPPSNPQPREPPAPPQPRSRPVSDGGSSVRSLPMTPTPPYARAAPPAPIEVLEPQPTDSPPHSAPPYVTRPSQDLSHLPTAAANSSPEAARSTRRLPLPPG